MRFDCSRKDFLFLWTWLSWKIRFIPESGDFIIIGWNDRLFLQKSLQILSVRGNRVGSLFWGFKPVWTGQNRLNRFLYNCHHRWLCFLCDTKMVEWSFITTVGQNRLRDAFLKLKWGQFRILYTGFTPKIKVKLNVNGHWGRILTLEGHVRSLTVVSYWR